MLIIHYFLPYGLVILVLFSDIMSQLPQGVWSILIGFAAVWLNSMFKNPNLVMNDLCEIPGFKSWSSTMIPQSLLFVSTVVFYLASFVTVTSNASLSQTSTTASVGGSGFAYSATGSVSTMSPSPSARIGATWGLAIAIVLFQAIGLVMTPGCLTEMRAFGNFSAAIAILIGLGIGGGAGAGFASQSFTQPSYLVTPQGGSQIIIPATGIPTPSSTQAKGPGFVREQFQLGTGLGEMPMASAGGQGGIPVDIAKSSGAVTPGESSDQFVCEAYKNGQLVTSTLVG
jgi:hypothetical protein